MSSPYIRSVPLRPARASAAAAVSEHSISCKCLVATPDHERPYSLTALARPIAAGRCTAVPNCPKIATCAATPAMRRACEAAFRDWMRRGVAADQQHPPPAHPPP
jgi:hypothetical protein